MSSPTLPPRGTLCLENKIYYTQDVESQSNLHVSGDHRKDLPHMYHQSVEVSRSSFLIVRLRHHISYDIVSTISVQSLVDGRTMRLVILTRDHLMYDRCDAHLSLISRSPDSSSSLHLSGSPGVCTRCKSREETAKTLESNLSSYSYWR